MCLSGMGGQTAGPALADFTPTPMAVPERELQQRAADWATAHFAATGEPWPQTAPHLHQQLEVAGFRFSLVMVKRVLKWLKDSLAFTVEKIGRVSLFKPVPVEPVTGQRTFVSRMSAEPERSKGEPERIRSGTEVEPQPNRNRTDPDPIPVETQPEGVPTCPRHNAKLVPSTKKSGSFHCPARDPVQPRGWCTFVLTPIDTPAGVNVNPGTLTGNDNESPGDAGAGDETNADGSTRSGYLDGFLRRYGRLPSETDPYLDSSSGGDPTTD